eukprot:c25229_g1_i1 orf=423-1595(-)
MAFATQLFSRTLVYPILRSKRKAPKWISSFERFPRRIYSLFSHVHHSRNYVATYNECRFNHYRFHKLELYTEKIVSSKSSPLIGRKESVHDDSRKDYSSESTTLEANGVRVVKSDKCTGMAAAESSTFPHIAVAENSEVVNPSSPSPFECSAAQIQATVKSHRTCSERPEMFSRPVTTGLLSQLTVAVDIDEVLGSFLTALNSFVAEQYFMHHEISDYHVYKFTEVWKCSRTEADERVRAFFESDHFNSGILPIPGAYRSLVQIAQYCQLYVVTSRQNAIKAPTLAWIERHYSGIFKEVHFGNHFAWEGEACPKSDICRLLGAELLIDDNPEYAMDCAERGIEVLLFDYNYSYPWSKTPDGPVHPLVTRVHNWQEVELTVQSRLKRKLGR